MSKRDWGLLVDDMLQSIERIEDYVRDMAWEDFLDDRKTQDAVVRNLEILGEAANALPGEICQKCPDVDWRGVIGMRNRLVHEYFDTSPSILWQVITVELSALRQQLRDLDS